MFKFLRKYNKWILAVGGTLLMIVFLIPQALEGLMQEAGVGRATRATIAGPDGRQHRVPAREWRQVQQEFEFVRQIERQGPVLPALGSIESSAHWFLLSLEAKRAGLVGNPRGLGLTDELILNYQLNTGLPRDVVLSAFAKMSGITRLLEMYLDVGELSDRRLKNFAARAFHNVDAQLLVFEAEADAVDFDPTDAQIQEQFEQFREVAPSDGPKGFGYLLPDRFKIEWIRIPADEVRQSVLEGDRMDGVALRAHWRRNPDGEFPPVESGAPVPDEVRDDLLQRLTNDTLEEVVRFAGDQLRAGRRGLRERDGYIVLPEDWDERQPSFRTMIEDIQERFDISLPEYTAIGDRWLTVDDIDDLGPIAEAKTERFGARALGLADLVEVLREFGGSPMITVQARVAGPPLRGPNQDVFIYRLTDVDPSRPPDSVDEVREELVNDLRRAEHFRELVERASAFEQEAIDRGMLGVSLDRDRDIHRVRVTLGDFDALLEQLQAGQPPRLTPSSLPVIGRHRPTVERIIDFALDLPQDVSTDEVPVEQRIVAVPVDDDLALLLLEITQQFPLTVEDYRDISFGGTLRALYISEEIDGTEQLRETFSFAALREKHNLELQMLDDDFAPEELEDLELTDLE